MVARNLEPLPISAGMTLGVNSLSELLRTISDALNGDRPALVPVPRGPAGKAVRAMAQPGVPLEEGAGGEPVVLVVPTSGSTGPPKGVLLTRSALEYSATATHHRLGGPGQWLLALPLTHIAGLQVLIRSLHSGLQPVPMDLTKGFDPLRFAVAEGKMGGSHRRYTALVPTQLRRLLDGPPEGREALAGFDAVLVGGALLDPALRSRAVAAGVRVVTTYGMSETCGGCVYDGVPLEGVEIDLPEAGGRVRLGGPVVFSGYRLRPDLTAAVLQVENGKRWHVTADSGWFDTSGRLQIRGRLDDMVVTGGENVATGAVESALALSPDVREVVVVGVPDAEWGERLVAVVVPSGSLAPDLATLRTFAARNLPPYALPRQLVLVRTIPMLRSGKPDRIALRRRALNAAAPEDAH